MQELFVMLPAGMLLQILMEIGFSVMVSLYTDFGVN